MWDFYGHLSSIALWNRSLTAAEVESVHPNHASLTGDEEGLVLYIPLDENHGTRARNLGSAGSKYDLVLGGFATGDAVTGGSGLDYDNDGVAETAATAPVWVNANRTAANSPPVVEDAAYEVGAAPLLPI